MVELVSIRDIEKKAAEIEKARTKKSMQDLQAIAEDNKKTAIENQAFNAFANAKLAEEAEKKMQKEIETAKAKAEQQVRRNWKGINSVCDDTDRETLFKGMLKDIGDNRNNK